MKSFDELYTTLQSASPETRFVINGEEKRIKGMVLLTTKNLPDNQHMKIVFTDGSFLLVMIQDREIYYADKLIGNIKEIKDGDIGNLDKIEYEGKSYKLGNKDDYQYVVRRYIGGPKDVEGEARFSDYFPEDGTKEFLSLGWLSETGERADINCKMIDLDNIKIL